MRQYGTKFSRMDQAKFVEKRIYVAKKVSLQYLVSIKGHTYLNKPIAFSGRFV